MTRTLTQNGPVSAGINWFGTLADRENYRDNTLSIRRTHRRARAYSAPMLHLILLDTSGSIHRGGALADAKGAIGALINRIYRERGQVELVGFGGRDITPLYRAKRAPSDAADLLNGIQSGGGTPLAKAMDWLSQRTQRINRQAPLCQLAVYIFTDARTREPLDSQPLQGTITVVDTECTPIKLGRAQRLAARLGARYQHLRQYPLS